MAIFGKIGNKKKEAFLDELRKGLRRGKAAEAVGISRETVRLAINSDVSFAAKVDQAELDACELVEDALFNQATKGNTTAIQVWLYNRWPERWQDQRNMNKGNALDLFLATLPAELSRALREYLVGTKPNSNPSVPSDK